MPTDLVTTDKIEKRGDLYVLLSAEGEVLGEFDTEAAAETARSQVKAVAPETFDAEEWVDTVDFAPFSKVEKVDSRDANGFMQVDCTVTVPGVYAYVRDGKIRHELKPESEIFAPTHMESIHGAVVTSEHPAGAVAVNPENSGKLQRGHSKSPPTRGSKGLDAALVVTDQALIDDIDSGRKTGVSEGMRNTFDHTPGIWTAPDGSKHPYDVIQTNMVANHLAIVTTPRVTAAQLHLDSLAQDGPQETNTMENQATLTIDGAELKTDATTASVVQAHVGRQDKEIAGLKSQLKEAATTNDSLVGEKDKALAERDTAHAERDGLKEELATADALDIDVLVTQRLAFLDRAKLVMPADKFDEAKGKSSIDIMRLTCDSLKIDLDGKSDAYIEARFDGLVDQSTATNDSAMLRSSLKPTPIQLSENAKHNKGLAEYYAAN
jgi:hypothetical protein